MAINKEKRPNFVIIRIMESTRTLLRVKAAKEGKKLYQVVEDLSHA